MKRTLTPPIRGARKLYINAVIAAIINPPTNIIMGITMTAPTPTKRPSQPRSNPPVAEGGMLANKVPNNKA